MSSSDRRPYLSATSMTQDVLDNSHDNLECRLEMIVEIETPDGFIYASDRNKYVGGTFYEALVNFPTIGRTVGEWLAPALQFSTLTIELSNVDGRFNKYLPGGDTFAGWVGKSVEVKIGLAESAGTYTSIFRGKITSIGGFSRSIKSITIISRDDLEQSNVDFPSSVFNTITYPKLETDLIGQLIPIIYGDFTVATDPKPASIPAIIVNGNDPLVDFEAEDVDISGPASPAVFTRASHALSDDTIIQLNTTGSLPSPFSTGVDYYVVNATTNTFQLSNTMGGVPIISTSAGTGSHTFEASPSETRVNVQFVISDNSNSSFQSDQVFVLRNDAFTQIPSSEIVNISGGNNYFEVKQKSGVTWISSDDGTTLVEYEFRTGDQFFVRVQGKDLSGYDDNIVWQARDILLTYTGLVAGDFDANWSTYRDKSTPAQSSISTIKSRIYINEVKNALEYALSLLEQVRLEAFPDRNLKLKINSLHFEDWDDSPSFTIKNWDVERNSTRLSIDERNVFNRAQGFFSYLPDRDQNAFQTSIYRNSAAITQHGQQISKKIEFPNLYIESDVVYQLIEIIRLASSSFEVVETNLTWRSLLQDIGGFTGLNVQIGSTILESVPAMIREIGYDPDGLKIPVKLWSMQMTPFPGYEPGFTGTVGGYDATIDEE